ncbi:MAG: hypothetical protein U5M72_04425 [Pseudomonas sp.]|nr:hypothetical protein [Pseudomonas sp.]
MAKAPVKKALPGDIVPAITVRSIPESFWRARRQFTQELQTIPLSELSEEDLAEIEAEPLLAVQRTEVEVPAALTDTGSGANDPANQGGNA